MEVKVKILTAAMLGCYLFSAISVFLVPFSDFRGAPAQQMLGYLCGIIFWLGALAGVGIYWYLVIDRKKRGQLPPKKLLELGFFQFGSSRPALINDILLGCMFLLMIVSMILPSFPGVVIMVVIFVFLITVHLHYILNGSLYDYIKEIGIELMKRMKKEGTQNEI